VDISVTVCFVFVCFLSLCVCTDTDFSAEDKASGVIFSRAVRRRPRQGTEGILHFGELCFPRSPKSDESNSVFISDNTINTS